MEIKNLGLLSKFRSYDIEALSLSAVLLSSHFLFFCIFIFRGSKSDLKVTWELENNNKLSSSVGRLIASSSWVQGRILSFADPDTQFV